MKDIQIPSCYNYIGVFLTFECNLRCSYCINHFSKNLKRRGKISGEEWARYLNRIQSRPDLPVTLQGGEPTLHPDIIHIINHLKPELNIDLLTNLQFDLEQFIRSVRPERLRRNAPYASIRVSYHPETMDLDDTIQRTLKMLNAGFSIGIWTVEHPARRKDIAAARQRCADRGIDFRAKEFLGEYNGKLYGTYRYKDACAKKERKNALCKASEFLIDPRGAVFRCHHDLYAGVNPAGRLDAPAFGLNEDYRNCEYYGFCNPCDVKVKTNRFQQYGHTSVDIVFPGKS